MRMLVWITLEREDAFMMVGQVDYDQNKFWPSKAIIIDRM